MPTTDQLVSALAADPSLAGLTDQAAADAINAKPPVTVAPVPLGLLGPLLRKVGLMAMLKSIAADASQPAQLRGAIGDFLDQLADTRQTNLDTTDAEIAARTAATLAGLAPVAQAAGVDPVAFTAAVYALGGGLRWPTGVQASDVTAARQAIALITAKAALLAWLEDKRQAAIAACDEGQRSGTLPTQAQLQAIFAPDQQAGG